MRICPSTLGNNDSTPYPPEIACCLASSLLKSRNSILAGRLPGVIALINWPFNNNQAHG